MEALRRVRWPPPRTIGESDELVVLREYTAVWTYVRARLYGLPLPSKVWAEAQLVAWDG